MVTAQTRKHEPADERITVRLPRSTRSIIERAAALCGESINQFIVQAAAERANEVLRSMETVKLSARDAQVFIDALANLPVPSKELLEAVQAHKGASRVHGLKARNLIVCPWMPSGMTA